MAIVINGSGTVTGLAVGGLPDGTVDAGTLAANSVDSAELVDGAVDTSHLAAVFPSSVSHVFSASDAQDIDFALASGTYIFVSVTKTGAVQSEIGYVVSDGSSLPTVDHASQTGTIVWSNPSGTTLRVRDNNNDKELIVFGWRIK